MLVLKMDPTVDISNEILKTPIAIFRSSNRQVLC